MPPYSHAIPLSAYPQRPARVLGSAATGAPSRRAAAPASDADEIFELHDPPFRVAPQNTNAKWAPDRGVNSPALRTPPPSYRTMGGAQGFYPDKKKGDAASDVEALLPQVPAPVRSTWCGLNPRRVLIALGCAAVTATIIGIAIGVKNLNSHKGSTTAPAKNGTASATPSARPSATTTTPSIAPTPTAGTLLNGSYAIAGSLSAAPCKGATGLSCAATVNALWLFTHDGDKYFVTPENMRTVTTNAQNGALSFEYGRGQHTGSGCVVSAVDTANLTLKGDYFTGTLKSVNTITTACTAGPIDAFCDCVYTVSGG